MNNHPLSKCPTVPTLYSGTLGQPSKIRDSTRDNPEIVSLKTLADRIVIQRQKQDSIWDTTRTKCPTPARPTETPKDGREIFIEDFIEAVEERAAIQQFDGGMDRMQATAEAYKAARFEFLIKEYQ